MRNTNGGVRVSSVNLLANSFMAFKLARGAGWSWLRVLAPILVAVALIIVFYAVWIILIKFRK